MATKPNETYKWGENATHEQVAAYEDTGWPSDVIPPKRTQFNWYQNLVGKWLGWAEDTVDLLVSTVLDRFFTEINAGTVEDPLDAIQLVPNEIGIYRLRYDVLGGVNDNERLVVVDELDTASVTAVTGGAYQVFRINRSGNQWTDDGVNFRRSTSVSDVTARNDTAYATPELLYQTGGQVTTGSNAYGGGWSEVTAGPDYFILQEWGTATLDASGEAEFSARFSEVYGYQSTGVVTATSRSGIADTVISGWLGSGLIRLAGVHLDGSNAVGVAVSWSYTIRLPR